MIRHHIIKKKGRFFFPSVVSEFVTGFSHKKTLRNIYVVLVNMQLLAVRKNWNG